MSVTFKDFFISAEVLLNNPSSTEMDFRNLISRSYYAAFLFGREIAEQFPIPIDESMYQQMGSHEKVIIKFEQHQESQLQKLGMMIRRCRNKRTNADYDVHLHIKRFEAAEHFYAVKSLLDKLEAIKNKELRP